MSSDAGPSDMADTIYPETTPRAPLERGACVERYVVVASIGRGGMGTVYRAFDPQLNRPVALKLLNTSGKGAAARVVRERLEREARALARLSHPNVLTVFDVGELDGDVFITTELVDGATLKEWLRAHKRTPRAIIDVFMAAGQGLIAAHRAGLVHRDFKPDNVIVGDDGRVRVIDFGLARVAGDESTASEAALAASALDAPARDGDAPTPVVATTPTPVEASTPTPVEASTPTPVEASAPTSVASTPTPAASTPPPAASAPPPVVSTPPTVVASTPTPQPAPAVAAIDASATPAERPRSRGVTALSGSMRSDGTLSRVDAPLTITGSIMGTPRYMAPEQHLGQVVDQRADQFSFCVALFEALSGRPPFAGLNPLELRENVVAGRFADPGDILRIPRFYRRAILRGLSTSPSARYPDLAALLRDLTPAQNERRWLAMLAIVASVVVVLGARWMQLSRQKLCAGREQRLTGIWDPARRAATRQALLATGVPYAANAAAAIEQVLDRYAVDWVATSTDACEAANLRHEQSAQMFDLRSTCLQDRLDHLRALVDVYASANPKTVERGVDAAQQLPPLTDCSDLTVLSAPVPPPAPADRAAVARVRQQLVRAESLGHAARYGDALVAARAADADAAKVPYRPLHAESKLRLGIAASDAADLPAAVSATREANIAAVSAGADGIAAQAASFLVSLVGDRQGHYAEAHELARWAQASIDRLPQHELKQAALEERLGTLYMREGKYQDALQHTQQAVAIESRQLRADDLSLSSSLQALGNVRYMRGEYAPAIESYERALAIRKTLYGPQHPSVVTVLINEANVWGDEGQHAKAVAMYEEALAIFAKTVPPDSPTVATVLNNLGDELRLIGQPQRALAMYQRALVIWQAKLGPHHSELAVAYHNIGDALNDLGQLPQALDAYEEALKLRLASVGEQHPYFALTLAAQGEVYRQLGDRAQAQAKLDRALALGEKTSGKDSAQVAFTLTAMGRLRLAAGDWVGARAALERAEPIWRAQPGEDVYGGENHLALAEVCWRAGERERALKLAADAKRAFDSVPRGRPRALAVGVWQSGHTLAAAPSPRSDR